MSAQILFLVGTLTTWVGLFFLLRAVYAAVRVLVKIPGMDWKRESNAILTNLAGAAAFLIVGATIPMDLGRPMSNSGTHFPLVWVMMPFTAWLTAISLVMSVLRILQRAFSILEDERLQRLWQAFWWFITSMVGLALFKWDQGEVQIFRGAVDMTVTKALTLLVYAVLAVAAMALAGRHAASRGWTKVVITHIALICGSVVFGIPFAWLMITSFKESRDMVSQHGIRWIPRIELSEEYMDPKDPLYEGEFQGRIVKGSLVSNLGNDMVKIDIDKPVNMRGLTFETKLSSLKEVPKNAKLITGKFGDQPITGLVAQDLEDGRKRVLIKEPASLKGTEYLANPGDTSPVMRNGLRVANYSEALEFLPAETIYGLVYLKNTLLIVILSVIGTVMSSSIVAYAFSRLRFPGKNAMFILLLSTMMLPSAVTLLPTFLIFRSLSWIDTLKPLWVPAFFASAFNVFLLRQFFSTIPMELEDAAKIDGCSYWRTFWRVMLPQIKPALAVIAIWTFMGTWNNFMGPLIYINSPENMPIAYAVQLFQGDRGGEPGLMMAFATMSILPVVALFFFAQRYFIEGVTLSGLGGR